jgi:hypothetical protein
MRRIILILALWVFLPVGLVSQDAPRPRIEGSMIGYIDNAIVGSHVRIRFDGGFDNAVPDRAEFFYAKCGCYKSLGGIIDEAFDPDASGPGGGVPETLNFQQLYLNFEYAPNSRISLFSELPVRWLQPQGFLPVPPFPAFSNQGGLSDIRAGVKLAMLASPDRYLTFQFRTYAGSGDGSKGLGTDHTSLEPTLLFYQRLSDRAASEFQIGSWHAVGGNHGVPTATSDKFSGSVLTYGIGPSYELYSGQAVRFAPVVELVGWRVLSGFQTQPGGPLFGAAADAGGANIVNIKFGARTAIGPRDSFYIGYGRALTDADWYDDIVRFEFRHAF